MFEAHFQTFDEPESGVALTARLSALRDELARRKLTGFVVPRADQQQNEYVAPKRGAAGLADRFYRIGGPRRGAGAGGGDLRRRPLHACRRESRSTARPGRSSRWSSRRRRAGFRNTSRLATASASIPGCTPRLRPNGSPRPAPRPAPSWSRSTATRSIRSGPSGPPPPLAPVAVHGPRYAGEDGGGKARRASGKRLDKLGADALVLSDSHAVAWTFNIRGADVAHTPLPLSYALVPREGRPTVFIDHRKLSNSHPRPSRAIRRRPRARRDWRRD